VAASDERTSDVGLAPLLAVCCGYFMVILDVTIVNVAAPAIGRELAASLTDLQWIVDGYTVAFAGLLLFGGALGRPLGTPPGVLPRGGPVHGLLPRLCRRG
jgi:MFS transporter, DHA2 family, methylenomycin A resistance protein